ncbi:MAG: hypothetical protein ABIH41_04755 [Nanoarchaeota archaeon]
MTLEEKLDVRPNVAKRWFYALEEYQREHPPRYVKWMSSLLERKDPSLAQRVATWYLGTFKIGAFLPSESEAASIAAGRDPQYWARNNAKYADMFAAMRYGLAAVVLEGHVMELIGQYQGTLPGDLAYAVADVIGKVPRPLDYLGASGLAVVSVAFAVERSKRNKYHEEHPGKASVSVLSFVLPLDYMIARSPDILAGVWRHAHSASGRIRRAVDDRLQAVQDILRRYVD